MIINNVNINWAAGEPYNTICECLDAITLLAVERAAAKYSDEFIEHLSDYTDGDTELEVALKDAAHALEVIKKYC